MQHLRLEAALLAALNDIPGVEKLCTAGTVEHALKGGAYPLVAVLYAGEDAETPQGRAQKVQQSWQVLIAVKPAGMSKDGSDARNALDPVLSAVLDRLRGLRFDTLKATPLVYQSCQVRHFGGGAAQALLGFQAGLLLPA